MKFYHFFGIRKFFRDGIRVAFDHWSEVVPLTFIEVDDETADIRIGFQRDEHGDDLPFDGTGNCYNRFQDYTI